MHDKSKLNRRDFLKKAALASAGLVLTSALPGCESPLPEQLVGPVGNLEGKGAMTVDFNGNSILAMRNAKGDIVVFSLVCSHKKCTVEWKPDPKEFHCPCHEGKYDKDGYVIDGPPPGPLRKFKYEIRGEELWVLNQPA